MNGLLAAADSDAPGNQSVATLTMNGRHVARDHHERQRRCIQFNINSRHDWQHSGQNLTNTDVDMTLFGAAATSLALTQDSLPPCSCCILVGHHRRNWFKKRGRGTLTIASPNLTYNRTTIINDWHLTCERIDYQRCPKNKSRPARWCRQHYRQHTRNGNICGWQQSWRAHHSMAI